MKKKFLALVLTLAMVLSLVPATALATDGTSDTTTKDVVYGHYEGNAWTEGAPTRTDGLKDTVTVNKTAEKVDGQDNQYNVTLTVQMKNKETAVLPGAAATVLVIDTSGSMNYCTKEEHQHTDACYQWEECTPQVNPDHYRWDGGHKILNTNCEYKDGRYIYPASQTCGKEGHTHTSDTCEAPYRINAAKEAAKNFLNSYRGGTVREDGTWVPSTNPLKRYISVVWFNKGVSSSEWLDVSTQPGYRTAINKINALSANEGTNLDAGLRMANAQLKNNTVKDMPANVVVLTDGKPTYYLTEATFLPSVEIGSGQYWIMNDGQDCTQNTYDQTVSTAQSLRSSVSGVYTVCFGASSEILSRVDGKPTVGTFLQEKVATQPEAGNTQKYAYEAQDADELNRVFAAISSSVVSGLNTGKVTDALPNGVSCTDGTFNEKGELTWQLDPAQATKRGPDSNGFITYTYEKTYKVQIDPTAEDLNVVKGGYVPLNRPTKLTVQHNGSPVQIPFPIPAGKVTATITFKSETGGTIGDNKTEISGSYASGSDFPTIPATTANDGYTFDGWYDKDGKKVETFPATVTGSATYTAKWTTNPAPPEPDSTDVYVYFQTQNTKGEPVDISGTSIQYNDRSWATLGKISTTQTLTSGTQYTGENDTLKAVGEEAKTKLTGNALWPENASIAPTVLAHIQWTKLAQLDGADDYVDAGTTCWHLDGQITGYKVTYATGAGEDAVIGMPDASETYYLSGSEYTVSSAAPTRTGYTFGGWMYQNSDETTYQANAKFDMPNEDVTLTARWTPNNGTKYQVEHYQQQLDDTYERTDTDTLSGETGASVTADPKTTYTGFTCDKTVTGTVERGTIAADGSLVLKLYYTRNSYNVTYQYEGTAPTGAPAVNTLSGAHKYGAEVTVDITVSANAVAGYTFSGWSTADATVTDGKFTMPANDVTLKGKFEKKTNPLTYTINQHFMDGEGKEIPSLYVSGDSQTGNKDTLLSNLIEGMTGTQSKGDKNYVYVSSKTTYTAVGEEAKPLDTTTSRLTKDTTIDLYYYLDNWKDGSSVEEDNEKGGDGIPDCDQVLIEYVSSNSERGTVSPDMEVLTIRKGNKTVVPTANGSTATTTGSSRNYFSNWTKDNTQVSTNATLNHQTILEVIKEFTGGKTYTFTANFGRSSGSGGSNRPKPPVVEIPDDVPTGLNGKDHYAYVVGYPDGMVYPQKNITRAEVATIFFRLLTDETREANMTKSNSYNDMKDGAWYTCAVSTLSKMGIIKGYEDGSFKPDASISRAEFAAIAARFDPDGDKTPATFSDVSSHWAKDEISIAANHGWIKGYEDGSFKPDQKITRAETMTLVNRVLKRLPETKDDLHKDMKTWPDNQNESAWFYLAVQEATNSHYQKLKKDGTHETWESMRETRDWAALEK